MLPGHLVVTRGQGRALGKCGAGSSLGSVGIPVLGSRAVVAGAGEEPGAPTRPGLSPGPGCALAQQPCHNSRGTCCGSPQQQQEFAGTIRTHHLLATPWCWGLEPSSRAVIRVSAIAWQSTRQSHTEALLALHGLCWWSSLTVAESRARPHFSQLYILTPFLGVPAHPHPSHSAQGSSQPLVTIPFHTGGQQYPLLAVTLIQLFPGLGCTAAVLIPQTGRYTGDLPR